MGECHNKSSKLYRSGGRSAARSEDVISRGADKITAQNGIEVISGLNKYIKMDKPIFTANGNSVSQYTGKIQQGNTSIEFGFYSDYNPQQTTTPTKQIKSQIIAIVWENGFIKSYNPLVETKTKSLKKSKKQYTETLETFKKMAGIKQIKY